MSSLLLYAFVWAPYICMEKMLIISNGFSSEASGPVLLKFHAEPPWAGERKMGMVHWSKWLPCPYMVKTFKNLLLHNQINLGPNLCTNYGGQEIYQNCSNDGSMLTFDLLASKVKFASLFVWAIYIYIESIEVTCRSTVVKIVLIGNLRWPSSGLYL